jgi:hypothetical protein
MDTFLGPAPPAACLRDPSAASSYVSWRPLATDDHLLYHCIKTPHLSEPPPLRAYQLLPSTCRDAFFENGDVCNHDHGPTTTTTTFDLAWTWVNGSDPLLHDAMVAAEEDAGHENAVGLQAGQKLYRCVVPPYLHAKQYYTQRWRHHLPRYQGCCGRRNWQPDILCAEWAAKAAKAGRSTQSESTKRNPARLCCRAAGWCGGGGRPRQGQGVTLALSIDQPSSPTLETTMNYDTRYDPPSPIFAPTHRPFTSSPPTFRSSCMQNPIAPIAHV